MRAVSFTVGAVRVDIEVGDEGAFEEGAGAELAGESLHVLIGEGAVFWKGDSQVADAACLREADGDTGALADLVRRKGLHLAQADDDEPLGGGS